jgi:nucleotide-binding universal stress UspA family protein
LGRAAEEIVVAAIQEDVDLIVLSRGKKSALTRFFTRRIAETVSRNAPCPVLSIEPHQSTRSTPVWRVPVLGEIAESF